MISACYVNEPPRQICGTCRYHWYEKVQDDWACGNPVSECYGIETDYTDECDEWEGKG